MTGDNLDQLTASQARVRELEGKLSIIQQQHRTLMDCAYAQIDELQAENKRLTEALQRLRASFGDTERYIPTRAEEGQITIIDAALNGGET
jgi:signal transduction protein with GAF and PtsI domain